MVKNRICYCVVNSTLYVRSRASSSRAPISNVEVNNFGSASFTQWIAVKTVIISLCFFYLAKSRSETKLSCFERQLIKKKHLWEGNASPVHVS